ncbi:MAG: IclR family transcriptional regulator [Betaproteobacteria bacterium]|nr:IclR family transcriptional regulator [Betaproteobacteria bacterium]
MPGDRPRTAGAAGGVAAVERALAILDAFSEQDRSLALADLAARTGYYKSTILRLSATLESRGYLTRLADRSWRLGPAASRLGAVYQAAFDMGDIVEPVLQAVVRETGETAAFHVREGNVRVSLYRVESPQRIRDHVRQGEHLPLERGAGGKVLLAFSGAKGAEFDRIRKRMIYVSLGDRIADLGGISAPVFGLGGRLAGALTVSVPLSRFDQRAVARFEPVVLSHAAALTRALGGDPAAYPKRKTASRAAA